MNTSFTRYDAHHAAKIEVLPQQEPDNQASLDCEYMGIRVLTTLPMLAEAFGVEAVEVEEINRRELEAIRKGDRVFFLEFGRHSACWFRVRRVRPSSDWDSGCAGIMIVNRDAWLSAFPGSTFAEGRVFKVLDDAFSERVTADLNGWLYTALVTEADGETMVYGGFLSEEEALKWAMTDHPDIRYAEEDFDVFWKLADSEA